MQTLTAGTTRGATPVGRPDSHASLAGLALIASVAAYGSFALAINRLAATRASTFRYAGQTVAPLGTGRLLERRCRRCSERQAHFETSAAGESVQAIDALLMVVLAAIWGGSFLIMRVAAPVLGPLPLTAIRVAIGAVALLAWAWLLGPRPRFPRPRGRYWVAGVLGNAVPFSLFAFAELALTAGLGSIINATAPFFAVVIGAIWARRLPHAGQTLGAVIGFIGVALLTGLGAADLTLAGLLPVVAALFATLCYGFMAHFTARHLRDVPSRDVAVAGMITATIVLALPAALTRTAAPFSAGAAAGAIVLGLLCTGVALRIYYHLIARAGANNAITVTLLVPVFGTLWGTLFLGESLSLPQFAGMGLIMIGVITVTGLGVRALAALRSGREHTRRAHDVDAERSRRP